MSVTVVTLRKNITVDNGDTLTVDFEEGRVVAIWLKQKDVKCRIRVYPEKVEKKP